MSPPKDRFYHWSSSMFLVSNIVPAPQNKGSHAIRHLVSPEDTTKTEGANGHGEVGDVLGVVKTIFWIAVSLSLSLLVGQLH